MYRFKCPKCANVLGVDDARGGETARCPKCGALLRLPAPAAQAPASPPAPAAAEAAPLVHVQAVPTPGLADPQPNGRAPAEVNGEPPAGPRRKRRKKRRRRKEASGSSRLAIGDGLFLGAMGVLTLWGAAMAVGGLFKPSLEVVVIIYGVILSLVGVVWLYMTALADGMELLPRPDMTGRGLIFSMLAGVWMLVALLVVVVTAGVFLATNPSRGWKPGLVGLLGVLFVVAGAMILYQLHPGLVGEAG